MSIRVMLRKTHPKKDGTYPIVLQIIKDRKVTIKSTGFHVKENQFKEGQGNWVIKHPDAILYNMAIEKKRSETLETTLSSRPVGHKTFFKAIDALMQRYENRNQVAAFNRLKTNKYYLQECWGKDIYLKDLNKSWVNKFTEHRYAQGNSDSTVKKNLQDLAVVLNNDDDYEGKNWFQLESKRINPKPVKREALTIEEIKLLENAKLEGLTELARDMFLFAFYAHGMRFESVVLLSPKDIRNGFIRYRMNKGQKIREIAIHDKLKAIIDKYKGKGQFLFPAVKEQPDAWSKKNIVGSANAWGRVYLKRAAILAGIDKYFTFHSARSSFAVIALTKGVSYSVLKDALGHSNFATTEQYIKSLTDRRINDSIKENKVFE